MPLGLITGASDGLGRAIATRLASHGWTLVIDARHPEPLHRLARELSRWSPVSAVPGDVADPDHRRELAEETGRLGRLELVIANASTLGPTPLRPLAELTVAELHRVLEVNVLGPFAIIGMSLPALRETSGVAIAISSDAAVEHYPDWGGYGASKAALDHLMLTLAAEHSPPRAASSAGQRDDPRFYAIDPGDMATAMQQAAFPGEDISDRRQPADVVPAILDLIHRRPPSGRYRAGNGVAEPALAAPATESTVPAGAVTS